MLATESTISNMTSAKEADGTSPKRAPRAHRWLRSEFVGSSDVSGVNRLPPRSKTSPTAIPGAPGGSLEAAVIPVMNPGCSRRGKSGMQFSIKQDGRWASGEIVQNRMAVTGGPTVVEYAGKLQTATKSGKTGISVWPQRISVEGSSPASLQIQLITILRT